MFSEQGSDSIPGASIVEPDAGEQLSPSCPLMSNGMGLSAATEIVLPYPAGLESLERFGDATKTERAAYQACGALPSAGSTFELERKSRSTFTPATVIALVMMLTFAYCSFPPQQRHNAEPVYGIEDRVDTWRFARSQSCWCRRVSRSQSCPWNAMMRFKPLVPLRCRSSM